MSRSRGFCFTINNYKESKETWLDILCHCNIKYCVIGEEKGKEGTPHLQGYVEFENARTLSGVIKLFNKHAHVETRKGSPEQAAEYCKKDGVFVETGDLPHQGKRNDLTEIGLQIAGGKSVDEIALEDPMIFHKYGRTLNKLEDLRLRKCYRTEMPEAIWYHGPTGVGKSHIAFTDYSPLTHYVYPNDNGWWDGYAGEATVIFNDFRGELPYNFLLQLIDKWPCTVRRRNREPIPFTSSKIIFTSALTPNEVYHGVVAKGDSLSQLMRRLTIIRVDGTSDTEVLEGNTAPRVLNEENATQILTEMLKS